MKFSQEVVESSLNKLNPKVGKVLNLEIYEQIPSTNEKLWELVDQGVSLPRAVIALTQTAGKGERGKVWESNQGGLYLSVALNTDISSQNATHLTMLSGVGISKALRDYHLPVKLKWPNDLLLQGHKLGGIKCETRIYQEKIITAVIGVGINWCNPVPKVGINLTSYYQHHQSVNQIKTLENLAAIAIDGLLCGYQDYCAKGIDFIMTGYLSNLDTLGRKVMINGSAGIVTGVTQQGELKVCLQSLGASTEICFSVGTISLGYD